MLGLKLNHVSKRGHRWRHVNSSALIQVMFGFFLPKSTKPLHEWMGTFSKRLSQQWLKLLIALLPGTIGIFSVNSHVFTYKGGLVTLWCSVLFYFDKTIHVSTSWCQYRSNTSIMHINTEGLVTEHCLWWDRRLSVGGSVMLIKVWQWKW